MSARRRRARRAAGFTLVELMMAIVLGSIFAVALYGFFFAGLDHARSQQTQALAQSTGRTAIDRMAADIRQAISPDGGLNPPVISVSPTALQIYVDGNRSASATTPRPQKVKYELLNGQLVRTTADPTNATPPWVYGAWNPPEVLVANVVNGSAAMFSSVTEKGAALPATPLSTQMRDVAQISIRLLIGQTTGANATTLELTTDVALRNATHL